MARMVTRSRRPISATGPPSHASSLPEVVRLIPARASITRPEQASRRFVAPFWPYSQL